MKPMIVAEELSSFLAIKHCQETKIGKVTRQSQSSIYKLVHILCATSGIAVNSFTPMGVRTGTKKSHLVDILW